MILRTKNGRKMVKKGQKLRFLAQKKGILMAAKNSVFARYTRVNVKFAV